jgi:glycosyltransferase involved in cell wall biosynthesis
MKIYYWSPFFTNIATIKAVIKSAESLIKFSKNKVNVSLLNSIGEWDYYRNEIKNGVDIINLNKIRLIDYLPKNGFLKSRVSYVIIFFWNFFKLINLINKKKPDYLIIHLMTSLPIFLSIFFNKKTRIILRISGLPKINIFRYFFWKIFSKKLYKVTCPTLKTYHYLIKQKIFGEDQLEILYDPIIDVSTFVKQKNDLLNLDILKNKKFIVGIGRLTKQKNFTLLINFFEKIKNKDFNLVILGIGEDKEKLVKMSKDFDIIDRVHFLNYQSNVFKFLVNAECFILTSLWEDPGFVIVEAGISNTSIISSDCPNGPKEIIGNNGFLFENNNLSDLHEKFNQFLDESNDNLLKKKVLLKKNLKKFTLFQHFKKLDNILK